MPYLWLEKKAISLVYRRSLAPRSLEEQIAQHREKVFYFLCAVLLIMAIAGLAFLMKADAVVRTIPGTK